MPINDYDLWELKPRNLTLAQREDPMLVIQDFFDYAHLPEARQQLWEMLKTIVTGNFPRTLNRRERTDLVYFYEQLEKLVEAAHLLYQNHRQHSFESIISEK
jgi:hypothetical protein